MDEITNMDPEQMSQQIYDVTSGRGKNRMKQHENSERINTTQFQTGVISSSNRSVMDILLSLKGFPDGELKRVLEIPVEPEPNADAIWSRTHFERLKNNYGHAIEPYAQGVISQLPVVRNLVDKIRDKVDIQASTRSTERYWSLIVALSITGGMVSKKLQLHDIPVQPVFDYGIQLIKDSRVKGKSYMFDADEFLSLFMKNKYHEVLIINGKQDKRTGLEQGPIREPRNALSMRYEPDTKMLYVSASSYRNECNRLSMNFDETLKPYIKAKALVVHPNNEVIRVKRMFVGTAAHNTAGTRCLWFDTTKLGFFNEEFLMDDDADIQSASTGGME